MRKTEIGLGIAAGTAGIVLGLLSLLGVLSYRSDTWILHDAQTTVVFGIILIAANALGILGALLVQKRHILGSAVMALVTVTVLVFGFPWQSLSAVIYIISVVMALVPAKAASL